jgi:hypothetical protein
LKPGDRGLLFQHLLDVVRGHMALDDVVADLRGVAGGFFVLEAGGLADGAHVGG